MNRAAASIDLIGQRFEAIESGTKKVTRALSDATGALNLLGEQGRVAAAALTPLANALNTISDANGALGTFFRGSSAARNMFSRLSSLIPAIGAVVTAGTALYGTYRAVVPATEAATDAEKKYQEMLRATEPYVRSTAEAVRDLEAAKRADARATTEGTIAALKADIAEYERDLEYLRELEQSAESQANAPVRRGALRGGAARQALENLPDTIREIEGKLSSLNRRLSESYARLESVDRPAEQAAQSLRSAARATGALEEALARLRIGRADTIDELKQQVSEVKQIWQATLTPFERYVQGSERIGELRETIESLYGAEGADVIIDRQARALQSALESAEARTERASDAARQLGMTFESAFERAIAGGEKLSVVLTALAN
ncbi:MAG: hypothetical protein N2444_07480, partial [Methylocystis sp.]|nr:hypothetical protein [Methylocystis sp.]